MTPRQIQRAIDDENAALERARAEIVRRESRLVLLYELQRLHSADERSNLSSNMQANVEGKSKATRISAGRATKGTPSRKAAIAADLPDGAIAVICDVGRSTVNAWHTGRRSIPPRHADALAAHKPKGIPRSAWARIGD